MIRLFITGMYRNFLRNKVSTLLNLASLVIGLTIFTLLSLIVNHELGYDKHHKNYDQIYRVQTRQEDSHPTNFCTYGPSAFRYHLVEDKPEVDAAVLMKEAAGQYFTLNDGSQLYEKYGYWSENSIFDIFTVKLLEGNAQTALTEPNAIALSESLSHKIFPEGGALGKKVVIGKRHPLTITAVYKDFPENSTLKPSFLVSLPTFDALKVRPGYRDNWTYIDWDTYVLLKKGADPSALDSKIKDAFSHTENLKKSTPYLHPLSKHHTSPNSQPDFLIGLSVLSFAAILILVLSCVNYVNLSMATSSLRAREIGIKKVVGAPKEALTAQFLGETLVLTFIALVTALMLSQLATPLLSRLLNKPLEVHLFSEGKLLALIGCVSLAAGLISGLYPAKVLSAYNPVKVLKGNLLESNRNSVSLKKVLVISQFSITLFMLVVGFILQAHVRFILNKDLGFKKEEILFSEVNFNDTVSFESVRQRLIQHPEIKDATCSFSIPFHSNNGGFVSWDGASPGEKVMISQNSVSTRFLDAYGIEMVSGRNFSPEFSADKNKCIINETALKTFGWKEFEGRQIHLNGRSYEVVGIVKDFHPYSVHNLIPVYILFHRPDKVRGNVMVTVRHSPGCGKQAKESIHAVLGELLPNDPFEFKNFDTLFIQDAAIPFWQSLKRIFFFFSVVTILVSVLGLLGLMIFTIQRRTKEIGIRKVLGSSVFDIFRKLSSEVLWLLVVSLVFAFPMSIFIYKLMPGAYKEPLSLLDFLFSFGIVALSAITAISYHVLKISIRNPVEALRYE